MAGKLTWLKQIGLDIVKGVAAAITGGEKVIVNALTAPGTLTSDLKDIIAAVRDVEAISATLKSKTLTGPEKLAAAAPLVQQVVLNSEFMYGKKIADQALFNEAVQGFTQAAVDLANSLEAQPASPTT